MAVSINSYQSETKKVKIEIACFTVICGDLWYDFKVSKTECRGFKSCFPCHLENRSFIFIDRTFLISVFCDIIRMVNSGEER